MEIFGDGGRENRAETAGGGRGGDRGDRRARAGGIVRGDASGNGHLYGCLHVCKMILMSGMLRSGCCLISGL